MHAGLHPSIHLESDRNRFGNPLDSNKIRKALSNIQADLGGLREAVVRRVVPASSSPNGYGSRAVVGFRRCDQDGCFARLGRPAISMTAPSQAIWPSDGGRIESGPPRSTQRRSADISRTGSSGAIPYKICRYITAIGECLPTYENRPPCPIQNQPQAYF